MPAHDLPLRLPSEGLCHDAHTGSRLAPNRLTINCLSAAGQSALPLIHISLCSRPIIWVHWCLGACRCHGCRSRLAITTRRVWSRARFARGVMVSERQQRRIANHLRSLQDSAHERAKSGPYMIAHPNIHPATNLQANGRFSAKSRYNTGRRISLVDCYWLRKPPHGSARSFSPLHPWTNWLKSTAPIETRGEHCCLSSIRSAGFSIQALHSALWGGMCRRCRLTQGARLFNWENTCFHDEADKLTSLLS